MAAEAHSLNPLLLSHWDDLLELSNGPSDAVTIDGLSLSVASVIAVAKYGSSASLSKNAVKSGERGAQMIEDGLEEGQVIYGVNTGFGGSADARTDAVDVQQEILHHLQHGILEGSAPVGSSAKQSNGETATSILASRATADSCTTAPTCMPEAWVRGTMLIRLNCFANDASGVRSSTMQMLLKLLMNDIVPRIPLRGSISASGDLSPLSYIASTMQGKPASTVWSGSRSNGERKIKRADEALSDHAISPIRFGPKETLAMVNGTAVSASVGALAIHDTLNLAMLSQILTAMSVEALKGTDESFDEFFGRIRPHPGQVESASNIHGLLRGSKLVSREFDPKTNSLRQDRYSIRTASQWIGPCLEDLRLAHDQILIELNSVTDNPVLNTDASSILHGGNFQAKSVTSAMEKARQASQSLGRMLFAQCTELINPATSNGLPPNLVLDEPSAAFTFKGTDVAVAALAAELGFLASPVGVHTQTAEMGNQALNSLALVAGRYALDAADVLGQLAASHLVALCQALDLRAMHQRFLDALTPAFDRSVRECFGDIVREHGNGRKDGFVREENDDEPALEHLRASAWTDFAAALPRTTSLDAPVRFARCADAAAPALLAALPDSSRAMRGLKAWTARIAADALTVFRRSRAEYRAAPNAAPLLGAGARRLYAFVRGELGVPFVASETLETPARPEREGDGDGDGVCEGAARGMGRYGTTMGGLITKVYEAMRDGRLYLVAVECIRQVSSEEGSS